MRINKFKEFNDKDILWIFDLDDTLIDTPSFDELAINFLKEKMSISDLLKMSVDKIGVSVNDLKWENGRIYINDIENKIKPIGNWKRKSNGRIYLLTPNKFIYSDISLSRNLKELSKFYNSVKNKCIVTARPIQIKDKIIKLLKELKLDIPKYGIHMFPAESGSGNPGWWKGKKIVEIIKETGFKKAHFYDDNSKTLNKVNKLIKLELPDIDWNFTKVK